MTINEEEPSPSVSIGRPTAAAATTTTNTNTNTTAASLINDDNCDGPLLDAASRDSSKKNKRIVNPARNLLQSSAMLLHQDNWRKAARVKDRDDFYDDDDGGGGDIDAADEKTSQRHLRRLSVVLAAVALCNLGLNASVLLVLRVSQGMEAIELLREQHLIKFHGNADLDRVCLQRGVCEGFGDEPIQLIGDAAGVNVRVANRYSAASASSLDVLMNGTASFANVRSYEVKHPLSGETIFSTESPSFRLNRAASVQRIQAELAQTHRVAAPKRRDLRVRGEKSLHLHGAEGASLDSKDVTWLARNDLTLKSREGDIVLEAKNGVAISELPVAPIYHPPSAARDQYKVCVCMPDGKLFLVPAHNKGDARVNCATYVRSMKNDPCAM